ncbi:hypothetical protein [Leeia oryzae]|uniref:hypothetical protein n=1 Tax=Leeia oryzae TaxID=356662 RepID=UPI0012EAAC25|nr:hypothetical protein [Leeia oryzae]
MKLAVFLCVLLVGLVTQAAPTKEDLVLALANTSDAALCYVNLVKPQWHDIIEPEILKRGVRCNMDKLAEGGLEALWVWRGRQQEKERAAMAAFLQKLRENAAKSQQPAW